MPERIQLSRKAGFRLPPGAINVARRGRWGNPFKVGDPGTETVEQAVGQFSHWLNVCKWDYLASVRDKLKGRDLACWCKPVTPCHGDVLLAVANAPLDFKWWWQEDILTAERAKALNLPVCSVWGGPRPGKATQPIGCGLKKHGVFLKTDCGGKIPIPFTHTYRFCPFCGGMIDPTPDWWAG